MKKAEIHFKNPFKEKFYYRFMDKEKFDRINAEEFQHEFMPSQHISQFELNSSKTKTLLKENDKSVQKTIHYDRIVLFDSASDTPAAAFEGYQQKIDTYYMRNSVVKKEYRGLGIYTDYCKRLINYTKNLGMMHLIGIHHAYNNPILIAKLKLGFHITGFNTDISWGTMVTTSYFNNPEYETLFKYRVGHMSFSEKLLNAAPKRVQDFYEKL